MGKPNIQYDPNADAMYIPLRDGEVDHTQPIDENTILDFDKKGNILGIEILFVRERDPNILKAFTVEEKQVC